MKNELIKLMLAAHAAATIQIPDTDHEDFRAKNSDIEGKTLPLTLYEASYTCDVDVKEITVTRFGVNTQCGATAPSISYIDSDGRKLQGSVDLFYERKDLAQAEIDYYISVANRDRANKELDDLVRKHLPSILEAAKREPGCRVKGGIYKQLTKDQQIALKVGDVVYWAAPDSDMEDWFIEEIDYSKGTCTVRWDNPFSKGSVDEYFNENALISDLYIKK